MSDTRDPDNPGRAALDWDCSAVIDRVFFFIDNELDQADCSQIQQHLDECGPCLAKYDLERTVKTLVSRSCTEVAPEGLRSRVLLSIRQVQVQITPTAAGASTVSTLPLDIRLSDVDVSRLSAILPSTLPTGPAQLQLSVNGVTGNRGAVFVVGP